jgi:type II secretory pathway pseudopilin PulG
MYLTTHTLVMIDTFLPRMPRPASEAGDTLLEVLISAMLVGLIVVGTLTAFGNVDRATAQERAHDEAAVLAAQSQEQLRSDPASALETIGTTGHSYTQTVGGKLEGGKLVGGTTYTITQKAELQPQSGSGATCSVTETTRQSGNAFAISSTVTWLVQKATKRSAVTASSIITPPTGSALEVDADNAPVATSGVSGVKAIVKYTPAGGGAAVTIEQTTGTEGCVVFGGIPSTEAEVEIPQIAGFVTRSGAAKYPSLGVNTQEVKLAPNYTTHHEILYNQGGAIKAAFAYKEQPKYKHANNEGVANAVEEEVTGDTFVAFNSNMESNPDFEVGSTNYAPPTALYNPVTGTYTPSAESPKFLFPFPASEEKPWNVYAGDCAENNPEKIAGIKPPTVYVTPGGVLSAVVPTSYVTLNLYAGKESEANSKGLADLETTTSRSVTITNTKCNGGEPPDNESAPSIKHVQATTINATRPGDGGHLADPFQPFGKEFELCVLDTEQNGGQIYRVKYENKALVGNNEKPIPIYLLQRPTVEVKNERKAKETEYKTKEAEYKAKEAYKTKKTEYEAKETAYKTKEAEYKTKETAYKTKEAEYKTEETAYKTKKTEYEAKETAYKAKEGEYKTKETAYKTKETAYKTKETEYKNKEAEYNTKKTEALKKAYEKLKSEYETLKGEYTTDKTAYETLKGEYTTDKTAYETLKGEYTTDKTAYETLKGEYTTDKTAYETDKHEYEEYSIPKQEYETDKSAYEQAKNEEGEGASVTVEKGTVCP